jgi:hypothetical protein
MEQVEVLHAEMEHALEASAQQVALRQLPL